MSVRAAWSSFAALVLTLGLAAAQAQEAPSPSGAAAALPAMIEPPFFEEAVAAGDLPPVAERIPQRPAVAAFDGTNATPGRYGGMLKVLGGSAKDTRTLVVWG